MLPPTLPVAPLPALAPPMPELAPVVVVPPGPEAAGPPVVSVPSCDEHERTNGMRAHTAMSKAERNLDEQNIFGPCRIGRFTSPIPSGNLVDSTLPSPLIRCCCPPSPTCPRSLGRGFQRCRWVKLPRVVVRIWSAKTSDLQLLPPDRTSKLPRFRELGSRIPCFPMPTTRRKSVLLQFRREYGRVLARWGVSSRRCWRTPTDRCRSRLPTGSRSVARARSP